MGERNESLADNPTDDLTENPANQPLFHGRDEVNDPGNGMPDPVGPATIISPPRSCAQVAAPFGSRNCSQPGTVKATLRNTIAQVPRWRYAWTRNRPIPASVMPQSASTSSDNASADRFPARSVSPSRALICSTSTTSWSRTTNSPSTRILGGTEALMCRSDAPHWTASAHRDSRDRGAPKTCGGSVGKGTSSSVGPRLGDLTSAGHVGMRDAS